MRYRTYSYRHAESILNANHRLKKEIEEILDQIHLPAPAPCLRPDYSSPHRQIQRAFLRRRWAAEVLVSPRAQHRQRFDLFKDRVGVEIELSSRDRLYRDYWRFLLAEADGKLDVGVIIVIDPDAEYVRAIGQRNGAPSLDDVIDDLNMLRPAIAVPIWAVALS